METTITTLVILFTFIFSHSVNAQTQEKNALYGLYNNVNKKDNFFKVLTLNNNSSFARIDPYLGVSPDPNPTTTTKGTWTIDLSVAEWGKLITFKASPQSDTKPVTCGYYFTHDTLHLAPVIFGSPDWKREYVLKKSPGIK